MFLSIPRCDDNFGVHPQQVNAEILSAYRIHAANQVLISSHFVIFYIG